MPETYTCNLLCPPNACAGAASHHVARFSVHCIRVNTQGLHQHTCHMATMGSDVTLNLTHVCTHMKSDGMGKLLAVHKC